MVQFADEDIGSSCEVVTLKSGTVVSEDVAGRWDDMNEQDQQTWKAFALELKGWIENNEDE